MSVNPKCVCLSRKITYGEFSEFVQEKKVHIVERTFSSGSYPLLKILRNNNKGLVLYSCRIKHARYNSKDIFDDISEPEKNSMQNCIKIFSIFLKHNPCIPILILIYYWKINVDHKSCKIKTQVHRGHCMYIQN